jgi:hypothetical protein
MTFFRPGTRGAAIGAAFHKRMLFRWPGVELEPDGVSFRIGAFWQPEREGNPMQKVNRRSPVALGLAAASAAVVKPAAAETTGYKDMTPWPGVVVRAHDGETQSIIVIMQPGSKTVGPPMENAMVCHITEGELRVEQDGKTLTAKKDFVWTCNKDTKEQAFNDGRVVAIMRITDLKA